MIFEVYVLEQDPSHSITGSWVEVFENGNDAQSYMSRYIDDVEQSGNVYSILCMGSFEDSEYAPGFNAPAMENFIK